MILPPGAYRFSNNAEGIARADALVKEFGEHAKRLSPTAVKILIGHQIGAPTATELLKLPVPAPSPRRASTHRAPLRVFTPYVEA